MGWWTSIIDTASSVTGWVGDHAGDIAAAAGVIAKVAGVALLAEGASDKAEGSSDKANGASDNANGASDNAEGTLGDGQNLVPKLYKWLQKNFKELTEAANKNIKPPTTNIADVHTTELDLCGVIPDTTTVKSGQAPASLCSDINKLLTMHGLPTTMGIRKDDIGMLVGEQMCTPPGTGKSPITLAEGTNTNFVSSPAISVGNDDYLITGGHIYYTIPSNGNKQGGDAWHSYLKLYAHQSPAHVDKWKQKKKALSVTGTTAPTPTSSYNSVTVAATWTAPGEDDTMAAAVNQLGTDHPDWTFGKNPSSDGQKFSYQFMTPIKVGPTAVLTAFQSAIADAQGKGQNLPGLKVTNQQTIIV